VTDSDRLGNLILGMRQAYSRGANAMEFARAHAATQDTSANEVDATTIAYDLQAGTYIENHERNPGQSVRVPQQIASRLRDLLPAGGSLLEVGVGEATTLGTVLSSLEDESDTLAFGFDLSWSRIAHGQQWLRRRDQPASLFVADLFRVPLQPNSIDIVYSCHSLEPNRGRERDAISECLRVASGFVLLAEPIYELASKDAKARMDRHGYVRGLKSTAEDLGVEVVEFELLPDPINPLNPTGILVLKKPGAEEAGPRTPKWRCPLTGEDLIELDDVFYSESVGIAYPKLRGVPLLRREHAVIASHLVEFGEK